MSIQSEKYDAAIALQQEGKVDDAIEQLKALVEETPDYALAHSALSKFYSDLGQHAQAIEHGQKVCELEPEDGFGFTALSTICMKADDRTLAEEALAKAREAQIAAIRKQQED